MSAAGPSQGAAQHRSGLRVHDLFNGDGNRRGRSEADGQLRRVSLAGRDVDYRLFRARRRSIGMQIGIAGLTVRAPRRASLREIESALIERSGWILRSLDEWRGRQRDVLPRVWKTGAPILYLGRELALAVHPARKEQISADLLNLTVLHPAASEEEEIATSVARWLRAETERTLLPCVAELAARITRTPPIAKLSNARSEWGSCNHKGVIRLHWRLVQLPPALAQYIVAHEVAHLAELNHSPRFWAVVERLFPGHRHARRELDEWTALLEA